MKSFIQRRRFLTGCLLIAGAGMLPLSGALIPVANRRLTFFKPSLAMLTKADFDPFLGTVFQLETAPGESAPLELIEVSGYPPRAMHSGASREPFSLLFRGGKDLVASQQIFKLHHPELGSYELFLVPVGNDEKGIRLEAVFS
jgi:hypothetical protein